MVKACGRSHVDLEEKQGGTSARAPEKHLFCGNPEIVAVGTLGAPRLSMDLRALALKALKALEALALKAFGLEVLGGLGLGGLGLEALGLQGLWP